MTGNKNDIECSDQLLGKQDVVVPSSGGLSRRHYWICFVVIVVLNVIGQAVGIRFVSVGIGLLLLVAMAFRLRNLGFSPWWSVSSIFFPWGFLVGLGCAICPDGFSETRRLDQIGRRIGWALLGLAVLANVALWIWFATISKK